MEAANPFAQVPTTPEPIISQVRRQLADEMRHGGSIPCGVLDRVADRAVRELWGSRIKTFVPVLALRQARDMLRQQDFVLRVEPPNTRDDIAHSPSTQGQATRPRDVLSVEDDVLPQDERDSMSL
jgi:hypothetical protein